MKQKSKKENNPYNRYGLKTLESKINELEKKIRHVDEYNKPLNEVWNEYYIAKNNAHKEIIKINNEYGNLVLPIKKWKKKFGFLGEEIAVPFNEEEKKIIDKLAEKGKKEINVWSELKKLEPHLSLKDKRSLETELLLVSKVYTRKKAKQDIIDKKVNLNENTKAIAANAINKGRLLADNLKNKILMTEKCPYCNQQLKNPHLDHIYPISKGGISSTTNLIYVCQSCNLKKSDLTLRNFINKYNLEKNRIEDTLENLGKDF